MPPLSVEFIYTKAINFAMQQNHMPVIHKLLIKNNSDADLTNITVAINSEPDFAKPHLFTVDQLQKNEVLEWDDIDLKINGQYLANLTEKLSGTLTVTISSKDAAAATTVLFTETYNIAILAYDQWDGIGRLPEILAAFITPNHPEIPGIIRRASNILGKWTGNPSFDEYQSLNPDRVKKQMAALYQAIAEQQFIYSAPPASFEDSGQRIRLADSIFSSRIGNCIDMSLLFAACMEAIGLHAIIVIIKGHAFTGAWLVKDTFSDAINYDASLLTKRIAEGIHEIALVEATAMNSGNLSTFDDATIQAAAHLLKVEDFTLFIDVKRARFSGIRPLPLRIATATGWQVAEEDLQLRNDALPQEINVTSKLIQTDAIEASKQRLWERKLLDLTLRNNLLNVRINKGMVQLISVNLAQLEDVFATGQEFQILAKPGDWDNPLRSAGVYQAIHHTDPVTELIKQEMTQRRLRSYLGDLELTESLTGLYRSSRLSLEENGANTLYIALGLLKWYETEASEKPRYAPLLLLPVEIVRKTTQKGFIVRSCDEETMMNITLLEMLRQDFGINIGGLENLPKDDSGVDVKAVFNTIRQAIMSNNRWDVEEQAFLGTFSFNKFIMWNDIHSNADKLKQNKIVASLVSGKLEWDTANDNNATTTDLDKAFHPASIILPISADSSQLEAISAAVNDQSFVLHGPPGTGKSQTITNIIANALYQGKKVLFVAEKMAALSVVEKRLDDIQLGAFCLELHSNKSKKSAILEQLKNTTEAVQKLSSGAFAAEAERLFIVRSKLNEYSEALHKKQPFGFSLYDAFNRYVQFVGTAGDIHFPSSVFSTLTPQQCVVWQDVAEELQTAGGLCGGPHNHPLQAVQITQYNSQIKAEAAQQLQEYQNTLNSYGASIADTCSALKIGEIPQQKERIDELNAIALLLLSAPNIPAGILAADNLEPTLEQIKSIAENGIRRNTLRDELLASFTSNFLHLSAEKLLHNWRQASQKWFLPKWLGHRAVVKEMNPYATTGKVDKDKVEGILITLAQYQKEQQVITSNQPLLQSILGFLWQQEDCNWAQLIIRCNTVITLNHRAINFYQSAAKAKQWRTAMASEFTEGSSAWLQVNKKGLEHFTSLCKSTMALQVQLTQTLGIDFTKNEQQDASWPNENLQLTQQLLQNLERLKDWCSYTSVKEKVLAAGLLHVVTPYERGLIQTADLVNSFQKGFYKSAAEYIIVQQPELAGFSGTLFEDKIRKFREISQRFEQITRDELYAKMASKIPSFAQEASQSSEIGILQKAIRNGGRGISIRKLFDSIPNLLPRLCPCMLMSPISAAQYLDVNHIQFDLVIFDEASQMPTCEAVGAMARGKNLIVVGDPKQMPPTSFFATNHFDEDNQEHEDLESILDDCLALSMPSRYLSWHYRSKHESLIAFSNARYYENKLFTFPSPDDIASKVKYIAVPGHYDRGKTKQNLAEATAIINEIKMRLASPVLQQQSMGVVTFSSVQQKLVQDLLDDTFRKHPELEAIANKNNEPIFIKNLENVQGDERDIILFSVGYGPDADGKVYLNFGPLNRDGGWRRLNVAVSRARYEMKVYATLKADQIDITRTAAQGVAGLKAFLEYAEKGKSALAFKSNTHASKSGNLELLLAGKISKEGYEVVTNIGCSGFRIDIGIVHPEKDNTYLLAILCDGQNYSAARNANDRDIVQPEVLKKLGWNVHRVWSADWWENEDKVMQGIFEAIKNASEKPVTTIADTPPAKLENNVNYASNATAAEPVVLPYHPYEVCRLTLVAANSLEDFLLPKNNQIIIRQIIQVLEKEAPISKDLLYKRVLAAWGIARMGARLQVHLDGHLKSLALQTTGNSNHPIYWNASQTPAGYGIYRIATNDQNKREPEDLPAEEVAAAIKHVLSLQISLPKNELVLATAKLFGFARRGTNVELAMLRGIELAINSKHAEEVMGRIVWKG